ncbi:hypothetical protein [Blastococcus sp. URHD0036]|uniref:hypothetical protein n=1 Tax=Blastococcus sp. URHD0036 TaxID=1380356 RepID=UPI00049546FC|nr:hypothetical protein [Blastococcus sp. URHD0036]
MSSRGLLVRCLACAAFLVVGAIALVGGLSLRPAGLLAVGLAAVVTGALAAGIAREASDDDLRATLEATWQTAAWTIGVLLVLAGVAAIAGALVTTLVGAGAGVAGLAVWLARTRPAAKPTRVVPPSSATPAAPARQAPPATPPARPAAVVTGNVAGTPASGGPLAALRIEALAQEWVSTSAALGLTLDPRSRAAIVRRREAVLDELERRDPAGFARWLAAGPLSATDPARYLRAGAAGTDAV